MKNIDLKNEIDSDQLILPIHILTVHVWFHPKDKDLIKLEEFDPLIKYKIKGDPDEWDADYSWYKPSKIRLLDVDYSYPLNYGWKS